MEKTEARLQQTFTGPVRPLIQSSRYASLRLKAAGQFSRLAGRTHPTADGQFPKQLTLNVSLTGARAIPRAAALSRRFGGCPSIGSAPQDFDALGTTGMTIAVCCHLFYQLRLQAA